MNISFNRSRVSVGVRRGESQIKYANRTRGATSLQSVHGDIIFEDISRLLSRKDLYSLSVTSSYFKKLLLPIVYAEVLPKSRRQTLGALASLKRCRYLCRYVKKLVIRPNDYDVWPNHWNPCRRLDETEVVNDILEVLEDLEILEAFEWYGLELPGGLLWYSLRMKCPTLKRVHSNVGTYIYPGGATLFDFEGLTGFSLTIREVLDVGESLPQQLWDMLVEKCPQLEDLTLTSRSPRLFDLKLFEGSWPVLKTLRIVYQGSSPLVDSSDMIPRDALYRFILRHPCIQDLTILHPFGIVPSFQQTGSTDDKRPPLQSLLPALKTYSGSPEILTHLSRLDLVESLSIKDHTVNFPWIGDQNLSKFFTVSQPRLCNLRRLSFQVKWLQLLTIKTGNTSLIHSIVDSCPNLEDLHIKTMTPTSTGEVKGVLHFLCQLRELKTLTFTKAPQSLFKGEIPLRTAIRAVRAVPSLDRVRIVHVQPYRVYERTREGVYDVIRGPGERVKLAVVERGQWKGLNAKIPWRGDTFNRTYFYSL